MNVWSFYSFRCLLFLPITIIISLTQLKAQIKLDPSVADYKIKRGGSLTFSYTEHLSVGLSAKYFFENTEVVILKRKKKRYQTPFRMILGMSGADKAKVKLVFKAITKGNTEIRIVDRFRLFEKIYVFNIEVI